MENELIGKWESTSQYLIENHESNFSNWTGQSPIEGHLVLSIEKEFEINIAKLGIPVAGSGLKGHYFIYKGRFELKENNIQIWQNEKVPLLLNYKMKNDRLILNVFERKIEFRKVLKEK